MKKLFTIAAATLVMFACNKTTEVNPNEAPKDDATLVLTMTGVKVATPQNSRAIGNPTKISEETLTDVQVLMFDATSKDLKKRLVLDPTLDFTAGTLVTRKLTVPSGAMDIYVVANSGITNWSSATNVTEFLKLTVDAATQNEANLTMTGCADNTTVTAGVSTNTVTVALQRLAAKVIVKWNTASLTSGTIAYTGAAAYIINTPSLTNLRTANVTIANGDYTPLAWYYGTGCTQVSGGTAIPVNHTASSVYAQSPITVNNSGTNVAQGVYFYVFENKTIAAGTPPTRAILKMKYTPTGGAARDTYYIVNVNKANANTIISEAGTALAKGVDGTKPYVHRNNVYTLNFNIKGEGMSDPWVEPTLTQLEVTMTIDDWVENSQDVDFD